MSAFQEATLEGFHCTLCKCTTDHSTYRQVILDMKHRPGGRSNLLVTLFPDVFKAKFSTAALTSLLLYVLNDTVIIVVPLLQSTMTSNFNNHHITLKLYRESSFSWAVFYLLGVIFWGGGGGGGGQGGASPQTFQLPLTQ